LKSGDVSNDETCNHYYHNVAGLITHWNASAEEFGNVASETIQQSSTNRGKSDHSQENE
jgi:hypothetical protein